MLSVSVVPTTNFLSIEAVGVATVIELFVPLTKGSLAGELISLAPTVVPAS